MFFLRCNCLLVLFVLIFACGCKCTCDVDEEQTGYALIEEEKKISISWIYLCAERDYAWASSLVEQVIDNRDISLSLTHLEELLKAVEKIQFAGATDIIYRSDTPFLGEGDNCIREPLILMPKDKLELAQRLSKRFNISSIRHSAWEYKDGFLDSLIILCRIEDEGNQAGSDTLSDQQND